MYNNSYTVPVPGYQVPYHTGENNNNNKSTSIYYAEHINQSSVTTTSSSSSSSTEAAGGGIAPATGTGASPRPIVSIYLVSKQ